MKFFKFKTAMFLLFVLFIAIPLNAQDDNLKLHSVSFGIGVLETTSDSSEGGFNWVGDIATRWRKNIFSLYANAASGFFVGTFGSDDSEDYLATSLTYGREIDLLSWARINQTTIFFSLDLPLIIWRF